MHPITMLLRRVTVALCLASLLVLAGCSAKNAARPTSIALNPDQGWIVGSFTIDNDKTDRKHVEPAMLRVGIGGYHLERNNTMTVTKNDFNDGRSRGFVFAIALPPGENAFSSIHTWDSHTDRSFSDASFWVPFQVEANKVTYVGEIMFSANMANNLFGLRTVPAGGWLTFSDASTRDLSLIDERYPALRSLERVIDVPRAAKAPHPLIRFE